MKTSFIPAFCLSCTLFCLTNCEQTAADKTPPPSAAATAPTAAEVVKRGEYLTNSLGCDDCHTPKTMTPQGPAPDMTRRFMGHPASETFVMDAEKKSLIQKQNVAVFSPGLTAAAGPWGVTYAANLTNDVTGLGSWTEAQFVKAIREGKNKGLDGTRPILPPMPWTSYRNLTDEDLKAVFAYLRSLPAIPNAVPAPTLMQ